MKQPETPNKEQVVEHRLAADLNIFEAAELVYVTPEVWHEWETGIAPMHPGLWELLRIKTAILQRRSRHKRHSLN